MELNMQIVEFQAGKLKHRLPACVDVLDLKQAGMFGLADAVSKFDPARKIYFRSYAPRRVYGAMIDYLRSVDWVPRRVHAKAKKTGAAVTQVGSISRIVAEGTNRKITVADELEAPAAPIPDADDTINRLTSGMSRVERMAFALYWFEGVTMRETGQAIGLSESRVSQMMSSIMLRIKAKFTEAQLRTLLGREDGAG